MGNVTEKTVRLNIPILESERCQAKMAALKKNIPLKDFVLAAINEKIIRENNGDTIKIND